MTYWKHVDHNDGRARMLADRHYSRQTIGAREFTPPGQKIVLLGKDDAAVWAIQRPAAASGVMRADGFKCWNNVIFRSERPKGSEPKAHHLIREAIAICVGLWPDLPEDGLHTFIDPNCVDPTFDDYGNPFYGFCFIAARFKFHSITKERKLHRLVMTRQQLQRINPIEPLYEQLRLFA